MRVDIYCVSLSLLHLFIVSVRIWLAEIEGLLRSSEVYHSQFLLLNELEALYPDVYRNVHEYGNRYCKGGVFGIYQGASNHEELHNLMKATIMIRRLKKDVLSELPVKCRQQMLSLQVVPHDFFIDAQVFLDLAEKDVKQINALFRESVALSIGDWFFDRVGVSAIDCPYPCLRVLPNLSYVLRESDIIKTTRICYTNLRDQAMRLCDTSMHMERTFQKDNFNHLNEKYDTDAPGIARTAPPTIVASVKPQIVPTPMSATPPPALTLAPTIAPYWGMCPNDALRVFDEMLERDLVAWIN
ncbi:hypothetical protein Syun_021377 [Stephania yunnanensis]|uniref:Uncharacterized protein n=1 Tax=Stephania yunnanensis TaxID=152371 RepID=A0AAP0NR08_9MAGN